MTKQFRQFSGDVGLSKGVIYELMGDEDRSRQHLLAQVDFEELTGTYFDAFLISGEATSWSYMGEHEKALQLSVRAMATLPRQKDHLFGTIIARTHTLLLARAGKRDEALERLAADLDKVEGFTRWELYLDPRWDFFRDDERFNELVRPLNLQEGEQ